MKITVSLVCFLIAIVCFALAAFKVPSAVEWRDAGFAFVVAAWVTA